MYIILSKGSLVRGCVGTNCLIEPRLSFHFFRTVSELVSSFAPYFIDPSRDQLRAVFDQFASQSKYGWLIPDPETFNRHLPVNQNRLDILTAIVYVVLRGSILSASYSLSALLMQHLSLANRLSTRLVCSRCGGGQTELLL